MATVEVESITSQAEKFDKIVVGKIVAIERHPNADKLKVVRVDIGTENTENKKTQKTQKHL